MSLDETLFDDAPNPYWLASTSAADYPALDEDIDVDVAIIGGGMVGISCAYMLVKEKFKVAVIEADRILHGTTGHTTAKITSQHSLIYARLKKEMGEEKAQQYANANQSAIQTIADIISNKNIDCDFVRQPAYVYTQSDKYIQDIEDEARVASNLGIMASYVDEVPLPFSVKAALRFDDQAQFHPLKYLQALIPDITENGSYIFEQTRAMNIERDKDFLVITHSGKKVRAPKVIIASHYPFFDGGGLYFSRLYTERSYVVGITAQGKFPEGMYISAEDPTRSLRSQSFEGGELILVGGEHHKTGQDSNTNQHYSNLIDWAKKTFRVVDIPYRWSTQDCMTLDGVPYVGPLTASRPDLYVATGFGKWGMTNSTAAAMMLTDLIVKGENAWTSVYNPSRFPDLTNLIVQNADVAKNYVSGKLEAPDNDEEIAKGEARAVNVDGERAGAYREQDGKLHLLDITCTHLGCELQWNNAERTWDCPCHGSRFGCQGNIVEGPALNVLKPVEESRNNVEPNVFQ